MLGIFHQQEAKQTVNLANTLIISSLCQEKSYKNKTKQKKTYLNPKKIQRKQTQTLQFPKKRQGINTKNLFIIYSITELKP